MATYKAGKIQVTATGRMKGAGVNWMAPNSLVRVGATVVIATNPVRIYTVGQIIGTGEIQLSDWGSDPAITTNTDYAILLHDGLTVQGLAQDTAETLRYYRNFEQTLGDASKMQVGEQPGQLMKVGAFGLGVNKNPDKLATTNYATSNEFMKDIMKNGNGWFRCGGISESGMQLFAHGSGFSSYCGDTITALNVDYSSGKMLVYTQTRAKIEQGEKPSRTVVYTSANKPDINSETNGVLAMSNGGTGKTNKEDIRVVLDQRIVDIPGNGQGEERAIRIATISTSAVVPDAYCNMIISGASGLGGGNKQNIEFVSISPRNGIDDNNNPNADYAILHRALNANASCQIGIVKSAPKTFDIYLRMPGYIRGCKIHVIGMLTNGSLISGPVVDGKIGDNKLIRVADIPTPAGNVSWATVNRIIEQSTSGSVDLDLRSLKINRASSTDNEARLRFNFDKGDNRGAELRSTYTNGNVVLSSGHDGSSTPVYGKLFLRANGNTNALNQFVLDPDGNATATGGQWKNASDIRLKKNFRGIESPLESVMSFRGATYEMKESGVRAVGVIAQDIEKRCPDAIGRMEIELEGETIKDAMSVDTAGFAAAYSVEAIKEVVRLMDLMLEDPEAARARIKALKEMINDKLPE